MEAICYHLTNFPRISAESGTFLDRTSVFLFARNIKRLATRCGSTGKRILQIVVMRLSCFTFRPLEFFLLSN